jgi:hypothetical protein
MKESSVSAAYIQKRFPARRLLAGAIIKETNMIGDNEFAIGFFKIPEEARRSAALSGFLRPPVFPRIESFQG